MRMHTRIGVLWTILRISSEQGTQSKAPTARNIYSTSVDRGNSDSLRGIYEAKSSGCFFYCTKWDLCLEEIPLNRSSHQGKLLQRETLDDCEIETSRRLRLSNLLCG